jgi:nitrile hydratase
VFDTPDSRGEAVAEDKVSRREFLAKSSLAASTTVAAGSMDEVSAQETEEFVQSDYSLRTKALVSVLTRKGLVDPASMDAVVDYHENQVGPHIGASVVAKSWVDPGYREQLLADARAVARDDGITGFQSTDLVAVENTPSVHNLVVCTLCSCYPWTLLGLPPKWYKDSAYRAQAVIDPRGVLRHFGLELDDDVEVRVWDSTAEVRYLVIPERPPGTEGMSVEQLAGLVTRDSMVGAEKLNAPP